MRPFMLSAMGPSRSSRFHLLSMDGRASDSSGSGSVLREESRAKLPLSQTQLFVRNGVGMPQQTRPPRSSGSHGFTRTAACPCGISATFWISSWSFSTLIIVSSVMPTRCVMAHSAIAGSDPRTVVVIVFCTSLWCHFPGSIVSGSVGSPAKNWATSSASFTWVSCAAMSSAPSWNSMRERCRVKSIILSASSAVFRSSSRTVSMDCPRPSWEVPVRSARRKTVGYCLRKSCSKGVKVSGKFACSFAVANLRPRLVPGCAT
mmetsp:Transcript_5717/g.15400  ORF Transcript_5717/g.15400 Transcript_5717/m.15400 type:complete len:261 (+) Transcript_5717:268-1050(+)